MFNIYYDDLQEGLWFQALNPRLANAVLTPITGATVQNPALTNVLAYDRPDIVLADTSHPILVVERTVEVPSGHNVGQRFARLAAAAQCRVPVVYFGPYAARKHGGQTEGPRYMNLRLFYALDNMATIETTSIETINWPVDDHYEIIQGSAKDARVRAYLQSFFRFYDGGGVAAVNSQMPDSDFHRQQRAERDTFVTHEVSRPDQYDGPPDSVTIGPTSNLAPLRGMANLHRLPHRDTVLYNVGMNNIRSDPYTGMAMLYEYLYAGGAARNARTRNMILHFPNISIAVWRRAVGSRRPRKDTRLFIRVADGILFRDGFLLATQLNLTT